MNTNQLLAKLVDGLSQPLADLLVAGALALIAKGYQYLSAHTKSVVVQTALARVDHAVEGAVKSVAQTEVDALKAASADGSLSPVEAAGAAASAMAKVKATLGGPSGVAAVAKALGVSDVDSVLTTHIEAKVRDLAAADGMPVLVPPAPDPLH